MKFVILLMFATAGAAWADISSDLFPDAPAMAERQHQIEHLKKVLNDPASTSGQRDAAAQTALLLLDADTKTIADSRDMATSNMKLAITMSQKAFPDKPATASDSGAAPQAVAAPAGQWREVATFSGTTSKNTEPFTITSNRWRVRWTSKISVNPVVYKGSLSEKEIDGLATLGLSAAHPDGSRAQDITIKTGSGSDSSELFGAGAWHLEVVAANSEWTATVEEFSAGN